MGPAISMNNLSLAIGGNQILAPLSAELEAGLLHLLIGPNGAGKTSLLKSMLGLTPYKGEVLRHWPEEQTLPVYIPQQPRFDQVLPVTIEDFLLAGISNKPVFLRSKRDELQKIESLLEQVGLQGKAQLQLGQLSGGERQRLMFAQALSRPASLWFLDEPMTGLDMDGQQLITDLILSLRQSGKTLVMVHHDMSFVAEHADNVLIIDGGLQSQGAPEQLNLNQAIQGQGAASLGEVA